MEINELVRMAHENAENHGFYENKGYDSNVKEKLLLIHAEISEACEADRENKHSNNDIAKRYINNKDDLSKIELKMTFENFIKNSFEDELADAVIRIADLAGYLDIDLDAHIQAKMLYNKGRPYKHGKIY